MAKTLQRQIIARALELIEDEAHWSRGAWARNARGQPCAWKSPGAVKFCALGALYRAAFEMAGDNVFDLAEKATIRISEGGPASLPHINDVEGHAAIVAAFKRALAS